MAKTKLDCFDFDGTLYNSPTNTKENHDLYEKATGIPWLINKELSRKLSKPGKFVPMRSGWFGRIETLQPPLVPSPAPDWWNRSVVDAFNKSLEDEAAVTVIMTGRHAGLKNAVLRICKEGKLFKLQTKHAKGGADYYEIVDDRVSFHCLGDNGPAPKGQKPNETLPWKLWVIEQYLDVYKELTTIEFWEDREEHIEPFKGLNTYGHTVIVNHVKADSSEPSSET